MSIPAESEPAVPAELRILNAEGVLLHEREPTPSTGHLLPIYEAMVRTRLLEARLDELHRAGHIGFFQATPGEEASVVAATAALRPEDWVFAGRREVGALLWRGVSAQRCLDGAFGNASDGGKGRQMPGQTSSRAANVVSSSGLPGNHLVHAAGCGWAARSRGDSAVAAAFFHETAAEAADFHTALNFAGVFAASVVFVGRNRGDKGALASKAIAYGIESVLCDGLDPLAVLTATARARERAASGKGPTLLEVHLPERTASADPIARARLFLERQGAWSAEAQAALEDRLRSEIDAAVAHAEQAPPPPPASLFDDVYARPPWHLSEQRSSLVGGVNPGDR